MDAVDVVVVGGGAMGAAAAWRLATRGRAVVLLERFGRCHAHGSSHGATRIFRVAYRDARYRSLAARALPLWRELEAEAGHVLLEQSGQLDHGPETVIDEIEQVLRVGGFAAERLSPGEAHERWPGMRFDAAVVHSPDGGRCFADRSVAAAWAAAERAGAQVREHTPVERIDVTGDRAVVHADGSRWSARTVVVAAGAWVAPLAGRHVALPALRVSDEHPAHFRPSIDGAAWPSFLHHGSDGGPLGFAAYGLATPGVGVKVGYGSGVPADPDRRARRPDREVVAALCRYVESWLPGLDPEPVEVISCLFTSTPDEHFVLDRRGPLVVCSPCSGHGFKFMPAVADLVADLVDGVDHGEAAWRLPS